MAISELINDLKISLAPYPKGRVFDGFRLSDYLGTPREVYKVPIPELRKIVKFFLRKHVELTDTTLAELLTVLMNGETATERGVASQIIGYHHPFRHKLKLTLLDQWLDNLTGWGEIDGLCQSNFSATEMLARWPEWQRLLTRFGRSKNISKQRASLVLLARPVRESADSRLAQLAFANIEKLETEHDILITKAISWLLRELITYHRAQVETYMSQHAKILPKIAVREVSRKLVTGKK